MPSEPAARGRHAQPAVFLSREAAGEEVLCDGGEAGEAVHAERAGGGADGEGDDEAEAVLDAAAAGFGEDPAPVEVVEAEHEPGEGFDDDLVEAVAGEGGHQNDGRIVAFFGLEPGEQRLEARIAEGAERILDGALAQFVGTGHRNNVSAGAGPGQRLREGLQ